ncbi:LuxR C-terminal-related transcriptional regulator [Paractinoplanes toevensis]|uniref:Transcriptional regulator n=1 Tax=Paractinoplanes toevensis TaxID=571911 RepID=A0A919W975_9ACTN|nr:LuxR C-terminal-related transcriptional regulator [Actinoplanes toevensis]GIM95947.1 transcriptional regulator [Actinoplanes toevensis]
MTAELVIPAPLSTPVESRATGGDPLLQSKFAMPEPPSFLVARPRLTERLARGVREPVTLVVGPAGAGKTQLVAAWAADGKPGYPIAWVTLEEEDRQSDTMWAYLLGALRRAGVEISASLTAPPGATAERSFLVRLAAALAEQPAPVVLVLDGVSNLAGQQWATDLEFVLRHTGRMLRLVLVGRWDPPLPLHRYRLAGRLEEIRSEDLAFTAEEATELLALHRLPLSRGATASLLQHTEGWAAGLRLFAMALKDSGDAESLVATITGNEATIAEYFVDEVLRIQPPHVRTFLLETSILDTFTPELAGAVTQRSDAQWLLAALCRQNAFVQPAGDGLSAYRCHRLFAELLQAQLSREAPDLIPELHRRAASWFAGTGQAIEAVAHAVAAGDGAMAAAIVVEDFAVGRLLVEGRRGRIGEHLSIASPDVDSPEGAVAAAALALSVRDVDTAAAHLDRAEELMISRTTGYTPALALAHLVTGVVLARLRDDIAGVLHAASAAEDLLSQMPAIHADRHRELRVLVLGAKGDAQSRLGAVDAAAVTLTEAANAATGTFDQVHIGALSHLALIEAHRGRLRHAEKLADQATELADRLGLDPANRPVGAELALAWVAMERYDIDTAGRHLRAADPRRIPPADGMIHAAFALIRSRRLQARGELRSALTALGDAAPAPGGLAAPAWLTRQLTLTRARLLIIMGRPDEAIEILAGLADPGADDAAVVTAAALTAGGDTDQAHEIVQPLAGAAGVAAPVSLEAWLVLATVAARRGELDDARAALRQALRAATPESQRRAVQQVWADLRRVLRDDDELAALYRQLQGAPAIDRPALNSGGAIVVFEQLSKREMEVLEGMAAMLPTEEIAATLYVSVNTVKTHVRSILRKLSASRRNEAVRRARALGLI